MRPFSEKPIRIHINEIVLKTNTPEIHASAYRSSKFKTPDLQVIED